MDRDWAALPRELLNLVVEKTESPKEFSFVCKSWRSAAKDTQSYCAMTTNPLLMISSQSYYKWSLYNPVDDKVLKTQLNLARQRFCGSSKGWLIVVDKNRLVSLINPFFSNDEKKIIHLPPLSPPSLIRLRRENYFVYKATISADPILNADNCIVTVVYEGICQLAFLRLNKDSQWTYILEKVDRGWWRTVEEVVQFEDRFYAVDLYGKVFSFDVTTPSVAPVKVVGRECDGENCYVTRYFVVCNEKTVLMVQRCMVGLDGHETKRITVFELNISKGEWTEKNTLGDVALFVGDNSSISVCASKSGCRANCIYFIHDNVGVEEGFGPRGAYDYGVYNVEEKRFLENPFHRDAGILMSKTVVSPIWIAPTYNL
ncbi:F-box/kelch-repeat protein At1g57790-like [Pyrus communis]|uniref:F-box/kelch-repeat protein At1g57790-like n=1 Tax=Pyrus communis TaxID=23211 RepID=UPI0035BF1533